MRRHKIKLLYADSLLRSIENRMDVFAANNVNERVHLHLDRQWYSPGDTIWFKAYTVAGEYHRLSTISGVLYTELINDQNNVVNRLALPLDSGISLGDFKLPDSLKSGVFHLRAYTNRMRNDSDYFYDQKIIIGQPVASPTNPGYAKPNLSAGNTILQNTADKTDLQFFPEGGNLINGLRSKVAFKATNRNGLAGMYRV